MAEAETTNTVKEETNTNEVTFTIEGKGKKGADSSLTDITFTKIKIGDVERRIEDDANHTTAKKALTELLTTSDETSDDPKIEEIDGGSSHRRKSYKKEKKIKGGKRKSLRRHKYV
jgi:hypothetical protein